MLLELLQPLYFTGDKHHDLALRYSLKSQFILKEKVHLE